MNRDACRVGCVILASGASVRFGEENKLLADCNGRPLLSHALAAVSAAISPPEHASCEQADPRPVLFPVVVCADAAVSALAKEAGFGVSCKPHPLQSDAVRDGLAVLLEQHDSLQGCMFVAGDQPLMKAETIRRLLDAFASAPDTPCRVAFGKRAGNPVLFPASFFDALLALSGDRGGSSLLKNCSVKLVSASDEAELLDVDTKDALTRVRSYLVSG